MEFIQIVSLLALYLLFLSTEINSSPRISRIQREEPILLHVIFRHGNRSANGPEELYPKDPYRNETYYPFGLGQLTNAGKIREYNIGKKLRATYNDFLGKYCLPETVDARSTDYNRTKMSLELVLASLYPPQEKQIWNVQLPWLPIPYNYWPRSQDPILLGVLCPRYIELYKQITNSPKIQAEYNKYKEIFAYISQNTGLNVTTFLDVYNLYFGLTTEEEWGFKLPQWTQKVWPKTIRDLTIKEYYVQTATTDLVRMASGYFLEKLIKDTQNHINGLTKGRKVYLYSAHESNIAELLIPLGIFDPPHVPNYGSYIVFEVHRKNNEYGFKIYYQNYDTNKPRLMKLPSCDYFCPFDKFVSLTEEYMPTPNLCYQ